MEISVMLKNLSSSRRRRCPSSWPCGSIRLAWQTVAWALEHRGMPVRIAARECLLHAERALAQRLAAMPNDGRDGRPAWSERRGVITSTWRDMVEPLAGAQHVYLTGADCGESSVGSDGENLVLALAAPRLQGVADAERRPSTTGRRPYPPLRNHPSSTRASSRTPSSLAGLRTARSTRRPSACSAG